MNNFSTSFGRTTAAALPYVMLAAIVVTVAAFKFSAVPRNTVTLPIEVYASDGFSATTPGDGDETVTIDIPDVAAVDSLGFRMHQPFYHQGGTAYSVQDGFEVQGAVAISVNGGRFVDVTESVIECAFPERAMECLSGQAPTVRFSTPKSISNGLVTGTNTITFRFNGTKGIRSGFRVIGIATLGGSTNIQNVNWMEGGLLSYGTTRFGWNNPTQWTAPSGGDAEQGRILFSARNTLEDHINQRNPSFPGDPITASCADCHAKDGMDLWYFNYSNETIIARSRFHGLTEQEGKDIAAYIRSLEYRTREGQFYDAPGRPWNPPFQPGATYGLDGAGVNAWDELTDDESHYWAAGAGLDDVLDYAIDEVKYLWPSGGDPGNGIPPSGIQYYSDPVTGQNELAWEPFRADRDDFDHKKYPIQIQLPDWNMWLPDVNPVGDFESGCDIRTWNGGAVWETYEWLAGDGSSTDWSASNVIGRDLTAPSQQWNIFKRILNFSSKAHNFWQKCAGKDASTIRNAHEDHGALGYRMVKIWEIHQYFDLYDVADVEMEYPFIDDATSSAAHDWELDIGMRGTGRAYFDPAPHVMGNLNTTPRLYGSAQGQLWATHTWYQLQTTVDPGNFPKSGSGNPVDWQYQDAFMAAWGDASGLDITARQFASQVRRWQEGYDTDLGVLPPSPDNYPGPQNFWDNRLLWAKQGTPMRMLGFAAHMRDHGKNGWSKWKKGAKLDGPLMKAIITAGLRAWMTPYMTEPVSDFQERQCTSNENSNAKSYCWEPASSVPDPNASLFVHNNKRDFYYQGLKLAADAGVAPSVIDSIATQWASPMWPQANASNYQNNGLPYSWESIASYTPPSDDGGGGGGGDGGSGDGSGEDDGGGAPPADVGTYAQTAGGSWISGGDVVPTGTNVTLGCNVTPTDGDAVTVEFFDNDRSLVTVDSSPYEHTYAPATGAHDVYCEARDADGVTRDDGFSYVVDENAGDPTTQALHLDEGWNLVSSRIAPDTPALDDLFAGVSALSVVMDEEGDVFLPDENTDDIGYWTPNEGYLVFMTAAETVTFEGQPLDVQSTIPLEQGWNLVTYLPTASLPVAEALASIQDELVMVKDVEGNAYLPEYDIDDIGSLVPGQGYRVFVTSPTELVYPQPSKRASRTVAPAASSSKASQ